MKIKVNYDLIDKIKESKTGVSLKRTNTKNFFVINMAMMLNIPSILTSEQPTFAFLTSFATVSTLSFIYRYLENKTFKEINAAVSISQLKQLASILRKHYINTDYELLQKAYEYETSYRFILDEDKMPQLKQEKYIMVPVVDRDVEKEVSLVQEHVVGTREYELSYGSPTKSKVLKPVFNC